MLLLSPFGAAVGRQINTFFLLRNQCCRRFLSSMNKAVKNSIEPIPSRGFFTSVPCCDQMSATFTSEEKSMASKEEHPVKVTGRLKKTTKYSEVNTPVTQTVESKSSVKVSPKSLEKSKNENLAHINEKKSKSMPAKKKDGEKKKPYKPFPTYFGEEKVELPEQLQHAMSNDPAYFHGIEGLGNQWSSPSVKPSKHPAVKAVLHQLYI